MLVLLGGLLSMAWAGDPCPELRSARPRVEVVRQHLEEGADPDQICTWSVRVPLLSTGFGIAFAIIAPPVGIPVGLAHKVDKTRKARPLALAVGTGDPDLVELLLAYRARPSAVDVERSVEKDQWRMVESLLAHGADPQLRTLPSPLAGDVERLAYARRAGVRLDEVRSIAPTHALRTDLPVALPFLDAGLPADVLLVAAADAGGEAVVAHCLTLTDPVSDAGVSALWQAVDDRRWPLVDQLLDAGVPIDPIDGRRCLICDTVWDNSRSATRELLRRGASPEPTGWGGPPLAHAARNGRVEMVDLLLEAGADPQGGLPSAVAEGRWAMVDHLVAAGARIDESEVLDAAIGYSRRDGVAQLLARGVPADAMASKGSWTVTAVKQRRTDLLAELVAAGAPIDGLTPPTSPLQAAIEGGHLQVVEAVLALGADPQRVPDPSKAWSRVYDDELREMLMAAGMPPSPGVFLGVVGRGDLGTIEHYLNMGADPSATDGFRTALGSAPSEEVEDLLLASGARPDPGYLDDLWRSRDLARLDEVFAVSGEGVESLAYRAMDDAVRERERDVVLWLLDRGADPNVPDFFGDPILMEALEWGDEEVVAAMLAAGARAEGVFRRGTALEVAIEAGRYESLAILVRRGAPLQPDPMAVWRTPEAAALFAGPEAIDALLGAGHPVTDRLLIEQAAHCDVEGLARHRPRWPKQIDRWGIRRAARRAGCGREVRELTSRASRRTR